MGAMCPKCGEWVERREFADVSMSTEAFQQGVELAIKVVTWHVYHGPDDSLAGNAREHIRALFGMEIDAEVARRFAKERK